MRPSTQSTTLSHRRLGRAAAAVGAVLGLLLGSVAAQAQAPVLVMPDSTNNRIVTFSPLDGAVINSNLFALAGGTPLHALGVGDEIWVSEQVGDRVSRWSADGTPLGQVGGGLTGGLDNIRGMAKAGNTVFITNAGTANGAPGAAVVMVSNTGAAMGSFSTATTAPSPFGLLGYQGGWLVSSSAANDDIHRYSLAGAPLGTFHNTATLNFAEQMAYASNGDVLVAGFSSNNIVRLNAATGAVITTYAASGARGVAQLGNGNVMWTSGSGAFVLDVNSGSSTQVYIGGGRYLETITVVPEPATMLLWAGGLFAVAVAARRRT
jgi:sugar lactone lactonase YvrE